MRVPRTKALPAPPHLVVLVEPTHVIRRGLDLLVSSQPDMEVGGAAASAEEALATLGALPRKVGVVVLVSMGTAAPQQASRLIRRIRESYPAMHLLALGNGSDAGSVSRAMFAGADGFIDREAELETLLGAVRGIARGETVLEGVPRDLLGAVAEGIEAHLEGIPVLSERQGEVLALAAEGLTARQIGARLGVRERTVTTHLYRLYQKLGVSGRVAAINEGGRLGLIPRTGRL